MVMPDHVRLIVTPLTDPEHRRLFPLHSILRGIKGYSARIINDRLGIRSTISQEESFDHVLRSSESLDAKIAYIVENPVRQGLVSIPQEYQWTWRKPVADSYNVAV
jgi:REP element-mobilizing transposase RayT